MKLAVCLLRVSSDRQLQEGQGIEVQKRTNDYFAERNSFYIVRYFTEHYSGRKANRYVLEEVIEYIEQSNGEISALIVSQIDRFTRAGADVYLFLQKRLRALGVELLDASGVIQQPQNTLEALGFEYEWSVRSPSRLTETILAEQANAEATQILTRCIGGQIETAKSGYQYKSPEFGYENAQTVTPDGRKRKVMVRKEPEAGWIEAMFRLRAEGVLSDEEICERVNAMGYKSRTFRRYDSVTREVIGIGGGVPLTTKQMHLHIRRTVYCGIRVGKWTHNKPIWLPHEVPRLVSLDTFNRANRGAIVIKVVGDEIILNKNARTRNSTKETGAFLYRHVITCPECKKPVKGSFSKSRSGKRIGYYHCNRSHDHWGVNVKVFESTVAKMVKRFTFKKKLIGLLKEIVRDVWIKHHKADEATKQQITLHIENLRDRQQQLVNRIERSQSASVQKALEGEYDDINATVEEAYSQLSHLENDDIQIEAYFAAIKDAVEHPEKWLLEPQSKEQMQKAWGLFFDEPPTWPEIESRTARMALPFRLLADSEMNESRLVELARSQSNQLIRHMTRCMAMD